MCVCVCVYIYIYIYIYIYEVFVLCIFHSMPDDGFLKTPKHAACLNNKGCCLKICLCYVVHLFILSSLLLSFLLCGSAQP